MYRFSLVHSGNMHVLIYCIIGHQEDRLICMGDFKLEQEAMMTTSCPLLNIQVRMAH